MAIDSSLIIKTSNVIQLGGVKFNNPTGKKIWYVDEDFSDVPRVENVAPNLIDWVRGGMGDDYNDYSYENMTGTWRYGAGILTYAKLIDIRPYVNNGAKYLYALGTRFLSLADASDESRIILLHGPVVFFYKDSSQNNKYTYYNESGGTNKAKLLKNLACDERIALNQGFNAYLSEIVYDLEKMVAVECNWIMVESINRSRGEVDCGTGNSSYCDYPNTAIDKPIVRWIYEE